MLGGVTDGRWIVRGACMLVALLACAGCGRGTVETRAAAKSPPVANAAPSEGNSSLEEGADAVEYKFHRNVAFTDVTKDLPDNSVDEIGIHMVDIAAKTNVVVVVTVTAPHKEGIRFTTTFKGPKEPGIKKQWSSPTSATDHDGKYVGIFVLPGHIDSASTIVE